MHACFFCLFDGCRATLSSQDLVVHGPAQGTYSWRLMANGLIACLLCWVFIMSAQWKTGKHYCRRSTRLPGTLMCSTIAKPVPCCHIAAHAYYFLHASALWSVHLHRILTAQLLPGYSKTMVHRTPLHVFLAYLILLVPTHVEDLMMPVRTHMNGPTAHHPTSQVMKYRTTVVMEPAEACPKANPARTHFIILPVASPKLVLRT